MATFSILAVLSVPHANIRHRFIRFDNRLNGSRKITLVYRERGCVHLEIIRGLDTSNRMQTKSMITSRGTIQRDDANVVNCFFSTGFVGFKLYLRCRIKNYSVR